MLTRREFLASIAGFTFAALGLRVKALNSFKFADEAERVFLVSIDACRSDYLPFMPNLQKLSSYGFVFENARTVVTSNTNSGHISMLTGAYPEVTGVSGNALYIKENGVYYFVLNDARQRNAESIIEALKRQDESIKIAFISGKWRVPPNLAFDRNGDMIADIVLTGPRSGIPLTPEEYKYILGVPETHKESVGADVRDPWTIAAMLEVVRRDDPEFMFVNLSSTDELQHLYAPHTPRFMTQISDVDRLLSLFIKKLEMMGKLSSTLFVITADHGQTATYNVFPLLPYLKKAGIEAEILLEGTSAFIYLEDEDDTDDTVEHLRKLVEKGIARDVLRREEYPKYRLPTDGRAGDIFVSYEEGWSAGFWGLTSTSPKNRIQEIRNYISVPGDHGSTAGSEMNVPLIFVGAGVDRGRHSGEVSIVDIVPTLCDMMGWHRPADVQGKSLAEIMGVF
jgi:predicted AlkP superfamily pyrophosphatase or phosphodiesterase